MSGKLHWVLILLVVAVTAPTAWAQGVSSSSGSSSQAGAPGAPVTSVEGASESTSNGQLQPDTHPLAGAYLFTLGSVLEGHSYFQPIFSLSEVGETNAQALVPGSNQNLETATMPTANLSVADVSRTNELFASYLGGGVIYNSLPSESTSFHMLNLGDSIEFRRLNVSFSDMFTYLPSASYGFGGFGLPAGASSGYMGGAGIPGGLGEINPGLASNQSILSNEYGVFNNTALVEVAYEATARTTLSFVGTYGTLQAGSHGAGFTRSNNIYGTAGVSHALTARDSIGMSYVYGAFHYVGLPESFNTQMAQFSYGRKITGRLSLQAYGGPELMTYTAPGLSARPRLLGSGTGSLIDQQGRNTFNLFGGRYVTGGSGLLTGAESTMVSAGWTRNLTQMWRSTVSSGYFRNSVLPGEPTNTGQHYSYWMGNMTLNRTLTRRVSFYISYEYEHQTENTSSCAAAVCAVRGAEQLFGIGIVFTPRPLGL